MPLYFLSGCLWKGKFNFVNGYYYFLDLVIFIWFSGISSLTILSFANIDNIATSLLPSLSYHLYSCWIEFVSTTMINKCSDSAHSCLDPELYWNPSSIISLCLLLLYIWLLHLFSFVLFFLGTSVIYWLYISHVLSYCFSPFFGILHDFCYSLSCALYTNDSKVKR